MTVPIRASLAFSAAAVCLVCAAFADPDKHAPAPAQAAAATPAHAPHWSYAGAGGPEHWGELGRDNAVCAKGLQQSPIDLAASVEATMDAPHGAWKASNWGTVANNGHTVQVSLKDPGEVDYEGAHYALKQFHFHYPSEHTLNGMHFPLEVHFVHAAPDGRLAVIGVMFREGPANPILERVIAKAPHEEGETVGALDIDVSGLMPANRDAFQYEGSLTTPPCSEIVHWTVMSQPLTASPTQIAAFRSMFGYNARPVQPLNRRFVLKTH